MYQNIARKTHEEVQRLGSDKAIARIDAKYDPLQGKVIIEEQLDEGQSSASSLKSKVRKTIDPYELRIKCRCAGCIDEVDGRQILQVKKVPEDVYPTNMERKGNYAVAVVWSDGHRSSIYPFERILSDDIEGATAEK